MATQKKNKKGRKVPLAEFLDGDSKLLTIRTTSNWSEIVDKEEADASVKPIIVDIGQLPTAPRAAQEIDYSNIGDEPPFIAFVSNLSFQIDDEGLRRIFADLNPKTARINRDGTRSRGTGIVEFEKRDQLIEGLKRTDKELYGRLIRVSVSDKTDTHQHHEGRQSYGHRSNRSGEERPGMDGQWQRGATRSEDDPDGRPASGFHRDRPHRNEFNRQNNRGPRDNQDRNNFGYGYPRSRDDRGGQGGNQDYNNRGNQRFRHGDDDNRSNSGADRPRYGGRYSDTRDVRERPKPPEDTPSEQREPPRERQRLQLQPRTKPLDTDQTLTRTVSSTNSTTDPFNSNNETTETSNRQTEDTLSSDNQQSNLNEAGPTENTTIQKPSRGAGSEIFGGAKPVDTLAKELEIERKLKEMELTKTESTEDQEEKHTSSRASYGRGGDRDHHRGKRSSNNDDHHPRDRHLNRRDDGRSDHGSEYHHRREHSGGKQYEDEGRRRSDDDHHRRGNDRHGGPLRRDPDSARQNKYHQQSQPDRDHDRTNYRPRDRETRHNDSNESNNQGRSSNNSFSTEPQPRNTQRGMNRRTAPAQDNSHRLELSNKFGMLNDDDLDDGDDNDEPQSPSFDE